MCNIMLFSGVTSVTGLISRACTRHHALVQLILLHTQCVHTCVTLCMQNLASGWGTASARVLGGDWLYLPRRCCRDCSVHPLPCWLQAISGQSPGFFLSKRAASSAASSPLKYSRATSLGVLPLCALCLSTAPLASRIEMQCLWPAAAA